MAEAKTRSVYVIRSEGGICKIGISFDPEDRLRSLLSGHGLGLELVHVEAVDIESALFVERAAHRMLEKTRTAGEWFKVSAEKAILAVQAAAWIVNDCARHGIQQANRLPPPDAQRAVTRREWERKTDDDIREQFGEAGAIIGQALKTFPAGPVGFVQIMGAVAAAGGPEIAQQTVVAYLRARGVPRLQGRRKYDGRKTTWYQNKSSPRLVKSVS